MSAACRGYPPSWWVPDTARDPHIVLARLICRHCPVTAACAASATPEDREHSIRAGQLPAWIVTTTSPEHRARRAAAKRRQRAAARTATNQLSLV